MLAAGGDDDKIARCAPSYHNGSKQVVYAPSLTAQKASSARLDGRHVDPRRSVRCLGGRHVDWARKNGLRVDEKSRLAA